MSKTQLKQSIFKQQYKILYINYKYIIYINTIYFLRLCINLQQFFSKKCKKLILINYKSNQFVINFLSHHFHFIKSSDYFKIQTPQIFYTPSFSAPNLQKYFIVSQTEKQKLEIIDSAKQQLITTIKKTPNDTQKVLDSIKKYFQCLLSYVEAYGKVDGNEKLEKQHFKNGQAPEFKVTSNFTKKSLLYCDPNFEIYYLLFTSITYQINRYFQLNQNNVSPDLLGQFVGQMKQCLGMFDSLRDFSRKITATDDVDIALETKTPLIDMCESLCRGLILFSGTERGIRENFECEEDNEKYSVKSLSNLIYSAQLAFEEVKSFLQVELKNDVRNMKKDLVDFVNVIYQVTLLIKDTLYYNILHDELMATEQIENEYEYEQKHKQMKLYAYRVKQEMDEYNRLCNIGAIGQWAKQRFSDLEATFRQVSYHGENQIKVSYQDLGEQVDIKPTEWTPPQASAEEIII